MTDNAPPRAFNVTTALSIAGGAALFALVVWQVGPAEIRDGFRRLGWGIAIVVALGGLRFAARAAAWLTCVESPHVLPFPVAFAAVIAGDTLGNATPLGPVVGEPAKAAYVRRQVPATVALTALAIENLLYSLSAAGMIAAGMVALLFAFDLPAGWREFSEMAIAGISGIFVVTMVALWRRPALLSRWLPLPARSGGTLRSKADRVRALESDIYTFASRRPGALAAAVLFEGIFHALGVLEAFITIWLLTDTQPTVLIAFLMETAQRLLAVAFKFVPFQIGVGEAGTAAFTRVLGLGEVLGLNFALARKARMTVWAAVGALLLIRHGASLPKEP
ncbi:MAG: lysylphosphatidylglycerol synthase transmembrane domain-containing protein [Vicinamibacterales bacterium]